MGSLVLSTASGRIVLDVATSPPSGDGVFVLSEYDGADPTGATYSQEALETALADAIAYGNGAILDLGGATNTWKFYPQKRYDTNSVGGGYNYPICILIAGVDGLTITGAAVDDRPTILMDAAPEVDGGDTRATRPTSSCGGASSSTSTTRPTARSAGSRSTGRRRPRWQPTIGGWRPMAGTFRTRARWSSSGRITSSFSPSTCKTSVVSLFIPTAIRLTSARLLSTAGPSPAPLPPCSPARPPSPCRTSRFAVLRRASRIMPMPAWTRSSMAATSTPR
jgi:hypothetical protein